VFSARNPDASEDVCMADLHSDAFVFFGASGDLAYKQIFPALQSLIQHGQLDLSIIGVSKSGWNLHRVRERARDSLKHHGGVDKRAFETLSARLDYVDGDYQEKSTYKLLPSGARLRKTTASLPRDSSQHVCHRRCPFGRVGLCKQCASCD